MALWAADWLPKASKKGHLRCKRALWPRFFPLESAMGRSSTTRKPLEDGDELALVLEKVLVDQHEQLLKRLDLRLGSLATILESRSCSPCASYDSLGPFKV